MKTWLEMYSVEEIRAAQNARKSLRRMKVPVRGSKRRLHDERLQKRPPVPYIRFLLERRATGAYDGMSLVEGTRSIGREWKALGAEEREVRHAVQMDKHCGAPI